MSASHCARQPAYFALSYLTALGTLAAIAPAQAQLLPSDLPWEVIPTYQMERPFYDAPGVLRNAILFHPTLIENFSYSDNIYASDIVQASDFISTTTANVSLAADWARHNLTGRGFYTQQLYVDHSSENASAFGVEASDRYAISSRSFLQIDAGFTQQPQSRATAEADSDDSQERPTYSTTSGAVSYFHRYGRLVDRAQVAVRKVDYLEDENAGRSSVLWSATNRIAYELRGRLTAFADISYVKHEWETRPDLRDFDVLRGNAGVRYIVPTVMEAEIGVGVLRQDFVNGDFDTLVTPAFQMNMTWNVLPLTTILANAERTVVGTETFCGGQLALCQGALDPSQRNTRETTAALIAVQHEFWHNFLGEVRVRYAKDRFDFNGLFNRTYGMTVNARYLVNRYMQLDLEYTHAARTANLPDDRTYNSGPYTENVVALTLRAGL